MDAHNVARLPRTAKKCEPNRPPPAELRQLCVLCSCQVSQYFAIKHMTRFLKRRENDQDDGTEFVLDQIIAGGLMRFTAKTAQRMV
jgi:hypothetical protein